MVDAEDKCTLGRSHHQYTARRALSLPGPARKRPALATRTRTQWGTYRVIERRAELGAYRLISRDLQREIPPQLRDGKSRASALPHEAGVGRSEDLRSRNAGDLAGAQLGEPAFPLQAPGLLNICDRACLKVAVEAGDQELRQACTIGRRQRQQLRLELVG